MVEPQVVEISVKDLALLTPGHADDKNLLSISDMKIEKEFLRERIISAASKKSRKVIEDIAKEEIELNVKVVDAPGRIRISDVSPVKIYEEDDEP